MISGRRSHAHESTDSGRQLSVKSLDSCLRFRSNTGYLRAHRGIRNETLKLQWYPILHMRRQGRTEKCSSALQSCESFEKRNHGAVRAVYLG